MATNYWRELAPVTSNNPQTTILPWLQTINIATAGHAGDTLKRTIADIEVGYRIIGDGTSWPPPGLLAEAYCLYGIWFDPSGTLGAGSIPLPGAHPSPWWVARGNLYPQAFSEPVQAGLSQIWTWTPKEQIDSKAQRKSTATQAGKLWLQVEWTTASSSTVGTGMTFTWNMKANCASLFEQH